MNYVLGPKIPAVKKYFQAGLRTGGPNYFYPRLVSPLFPLILRQCNPFIPGPGPSRPNSGLSLSRDGAPGPQGKEDEDMKISLQKISLTFAAGCLGGLLNALFLWLFGVLGVTTALGIKFAPAFIPPWLYQRLVWGGLWGWLFLLPLKRLSYSARGLLYSLGPFCVASFIVLPFQAHKGVLGLQLGTLTPVFVLFSNAIWGLAAGWWLALTERQYQG